MCDENAEYKNETCMCKEGYWGNGIVCYEKKGEVLSLHSKLYQSVGRRWMACVRDPRMYKIRP